MHVYALVSSTTTRSLLLPIGVANSLELLIQANLAAVVEPDLHLEELRQDDAILLQAVLAHDRVIRELFAQTTVLPLRFTSFPTLTELITDLQINQQLYGQRLTRLQGKAEYTVKFVPKEFQDVAISPDLKGKDYFLAKKQQYQAQHQQREQQTQELQHLLTVIAAQYPTVTPPEAQQAHILVDQADKVILQEWCDRLQHQVSWWKLCLGEAVPPFHFV